MPLAKEELGRRIRSARERAHLTQQDVADRMGTSWRIVQRWDTGQSHPRAHNLPKLAEILGVDIDLLQEPQAEHIYDRLERKIDENGKLARTALGLLDELLREVRQNREEVTGLITERSRAIGDRLDELEARQDANEAELSQVQADFLQALGVNARPHGADAGEQGSGKGSTRTSGTRPAGDR